MPGLQERYREDSDSEEESYQQNCQKEKTRHPHNNNAPTQYLSDNSDSDSINADVPEQASKDDDDDLSTDSNDGTIVSASKHYQPLCMQGRHLEDKMLMTANSSAAIPPTPKNDINTILIEIEIQTNSGYIFLQNKIERQMLIDIDEDEAAAIGGSMELPKLLNMICISGCNLNGINGSNLHS